MRSVWYPQWCSVVVKLLYRDEWVLKVWGSCALSTLSSIHTLLCDVIQKLERRCYPPLIPCIIGHFFSMTMKIFILPKLPIKDQSIQGGRPQGVKQDRCKNLSWTCTLSAKKGQSSILKVLEDILSTRILYICWIKSRVYSFLQSFI